MVTMDKPTPVDPKLLDLLVCPLTKGPLHYDRERQELVSEQAGLAYPIRDGIPIMLVDEARPIDEDQKVPEQVRAGPAGGQDGDDG
jgi:uncharacterized protein YbaR (Trm112 family)